MAASAVNVMLAVHEKKTTAVDLYRPLRQYIATNFSEREAQMAEDDLDSVRQMRSEVEKPTNPSPESRRDLLLSYYRAIALIEPRFPISADRSHVNSLNFTWYDAFKPSKKASLQSIHLEKSAILFNIGAAYSQIALSADRTSPAGLKQACNGFQSAAGAFSMLREAVAPKLAALGGATIDLSVECAGMLERLMLAQAQECFFEKVIADAKPHGICSKVARQWRFIVLVGTRCKTVFEEINGKCIVGLFYEEAYATLNAAPLNQHFDRTWISHIQLKAAQFYAEACYRCSLELHGKEEIAEEIARLKIGINALTDAKKSVKGIAAPLLDAVSRLEGYMNQNLERAIKENDRVYLMRVPPASSLISLPAASLVKPVLMNEVLDASKERLFSNLIPDNSTKSLSRYTEMVDDIIRTQAEKLQQGSEITRVKLKEMDLPDSILALDGSFSLPMDLKEDVEAVQISGGPAGLEAELQQLTDLRRVNQELLVQTEELLQKEANEDTQFRTQFGTKWTRPQSSTLTKNLLDRLNRFAANLKQAAESDARIERSIRDHSTFMSILDRRPDDILPKLLATSGSHEDLFKKEIAKYDSIREEITHNIEAQEQLLLQIQAQNEEFAAIFNLEDYKVARDKCYKQIAAAIAKYREIKDNINEGMKFYVTLQDAINNVKQQCSDFVMTRNIQCREMLEDVQRQMAGLNFASGQSNLPRTTSHPSSDPQPAPRPSSFTLPFFHRPSEHARPGFSQPYTNYSQQPPPPPPPSPYQAPGQYQQYTNQPPPPSHDYSQPAYPGWRGPYYNTQMQQPATGHPPPSPYNIPPQNYPQGGYYRPQ
ncbi:hypothetical protein MA16_Dca021751 [Dendrobium catenatum]|uniref:BRO1 domain-containing protein n=1 Tax=Dendrobium catenatum TaxID=906689 RepID=A0A2I0V8L4_9ASPA|nr:hypothetical protein MA16_Dca021751 [Dendrobium catenatum]